MDVSADMTWTEKIMLASLNKDWDASFEKFGGMSSPKHVKLKHSFKKNYFGLPIGANPITGDGIAYLSRKFAEKNSTVEEQEITTSVGEEKDVLNEDDIISNDKNSKSESNIAAQLKVSKALLTMCKNESMNYHFIYKGGLEAVFKVVGECKDREVLATCANCLSHSSESDDTCEVLLKKNVYDTLSLLIEYGNDTTKVFVGRTISNMTSQQKLEEPLVNRGYVVITNALMASTEDPVVLGYSLLSLCNLAPSMVGLDAEMTVRSLSQVAKRLNVLKDSDAAIFIAEVFHNFSKVSHYSALLCEEGIMTWAVAMLETYDIPILFEKCMETFFYLSLNRKNKREIVSSGIHHHLSKILSVGTETCVTHTLLMLGNLLSGDLYHDKVAKDEIISLIVQRPSPANPKLLLAASYCLCYLAHIPSAAEVLVRNNVVSRVLELISVSQMKEARAYLWNILVKLSSKEDFFDVIIKEKSLMTIVLNEASVEGSDLHGNLSELLLNLSIRPEVGKALEYANVVLLVKSCKILFVNAIGHPDSAKTVQATALTTLNNIAINIPYSRTDILDADLITMLDNSGFSDRYVNLQFCLLLNAISNEEFCCAKLLDFGVQRLLISLQDKFSDEQLGKDVTAAILHNLSLKRSTVVPGLLPTVLLLVKNCKDLRVLWSVRAIANYSCHSKSRLVLTKDKKLIPILNGIMRYGCAQADKVQQYCAIAICNILSTNLDREVLEYLLKTGAVVDLVVATLLRVNSGAAKEYLGKALFNLLCRSEFRMKFVDLEVLDALTELGKIENVELLDLCVRSVYNISCEVEKYAPKINRLRLVDMLCARSSGSSDIAGAKATNEVKIYCAMALVNMSFNSQLANDFLLCSYAPDCIRSLKNIENEEVIQYISVILFNASFLSTCAALADTCVVPILVSILTRGGTMPLQLPVAALVNFSLHKDFYSQLTSVAVPVIVNNVMMVPAIDIRVKLDALYMIYNLVTAHAPARIAIIDAGVVLALSKILKVNDDEQTLRLCGRIIKEMSMETVVHKKLLNDGVMHIILKLSKVELPLLKLDLSCAIYCLTTVSDLMKLLKRDGVDILFWLTLHDCLNLYDPIRKNCGKALRNITIRKDEAIMLVAEERFQPILKALCKSRNEEVLWEAAGILYNLMSIEECKQTLLQRNVVSLIFEVASAGYTNVRHVCSACLHMVPDNIPNMEDPDVLQLVLCLLESNQVSNLFGTIGEKDYTLLGELLGGQNANSTNFVLWDGALPSSGTSFKYESSLTKLEANWLTTPCEVDKVFTSVYIHQSGQSVDAVASKALGLSSALSAHFEAPHMKRKGAFFDDFARFGEYKILEQQQNEALRRQQELLMELDWEANGSKREGGGSSSSRRRRSIGGASRKSFDGGTSNNSSKTPSRRPSLDIAGAMKFAVESTIEESPQKSVISTIPDITAPPPQGLVHSMSERFAQLPQMPPHHTNSAVILPKIKDSLYCEEYLPSDSLGSIKFAMSKEKQKKAALELKELKQKNAVYNGFSTSVGATSNLTATDFSGMENMMSREMTQSLPNFKPQANFLPVATMLGKSLQDAFPSNSRQSSKHSSDTPVKTSSGGKRSAGKRSR